MIARGLLETTRCWPCRGVVLVVTLFVVIVLAGFALAFSLAMRVEAYTGANRVAAAQARAIALGAARAVLALGEELPTDAVPVGTGAFWLLQANFEDDRLYAYGITDEAGKVNLNSAPRDMLLALPGMDEALVDAVLDWRDEDDEAQPYGAESDYYLLLPQPYLAKNAPFETVEELLLVRDFTPLELYGEDMNRNGVLDDNENDAGETLPPDNRDGQLNRGLIDFVTVYSRTDLTGLVNVNQLQGGPQGPGGGQGSSGGPQGGAGQLREAVKEAAEEGLLPQDRVEAVVGAIAGAVPCRNLIDLYYKSGLSLEEFSAVSSKLTVWSGEERVGLINVNTAPKEVLCALPALEEADADALISYRQSQGAGQGSAESQEELGAAGNPLSSVAWVTKVLDEEKATAIGDFITTTSSQHSVDIVAVSGDGRAFERYRMVYDTSGEMPRILFWQRLTHLGWPLDPEILRELRSGTAVADLPRTTDRGSF